MCYKLICNTKNILLKTGVKILIIYLGSADDGRKFYSRPFYYSQKWKRKFIRMSMS